MGKTSKTAVGHLPAVTGLARVDIYVDALAELGWLGRGLGRGLGGRRRLLEVLVLVLVLMLVLVVLGVRVDVGACVLLLGEPVARLLVDVDFFTAVGRVRRVVRGGGKRRRRRTADAVFFVDVDLLLNVGVATLRRRRRRGRGLVVDGGREGGVMLFVTFPSDVRSLSRKLLLAFYLDLC